MPKFATVVEEVDAALQAALRISPGTPVDQLKRELFDRNPELYERLRGESSDQTFEGRQRFLEGQQRCRIIGHGKHAIALAGAREALGYAAARDASQASETISPATRTMQEIARLVDLEMKRDPNVTAAEARRRCFTANPSLYTQYRAATTRTKGGQR